MRRTGPLPPPRPRDGDQAAPRDCRRRARRGGRPKTPMRTPNNSATPQPSLASTWQRASPNRRLLGHGHHCDSPLAHTRARAAGAASSPGTSRRFDGARRVCGAEVRPRGCRCKPPRCSRARCKGARDAATTPRPPARPPRSRGRGPRTEEGGRERPPEEEVGNPPPFLFMSLFKKIIYLLVPVHPRRRFRSVGMESSTQLWNPR